MIQTMYGILRVDLHSSHKNLVLALIESEYNQPKQTLTNFMGSIKKNLQSNRLGV